jgi:hypothetical protein
MISDAGRRVACVPERVPLVAGLEDEVARLAEGDLVAEQRADAQAVRLMCGLVAAAGCASASGTTSGCPSATVTR